MIETSWAYSQFKNGLDTSGSSINFADLLNKKTVSFNKLKLIENDFESIVIPAYPEIGEIKKSSVHLRSMPVCRVRARLCLGFLMMRPY